MSGGSGGAEARALRRLRGRLTLLCTALTGAVLLAMALVALALAEGQIRRGAEATFQSNLNAVSAKLQTDRVVSATWLAQTEAADRLILSISDAGTPLRFPGAWTPDTARQILVERAAQAGRAAGVDVEVPPLSSITPTASPIYEVDGDAGDRYLAAVAVIPAGSSWQSLVILRDNAASDGRVFSLRAAFAALVLLGAAALFLLCWLFAGRALRPIEESRRRHSEFIAAASHELRAPLAVVRTSASALALAGEEDRARLRGAIEAECARMARLVDDLLCLARSDAGTWSVRRQRVDTDTLLLETAEGFYSVAHRRGQRLTLSVPDEPLPPVQGDPERLRQILCVLLDNAFSYTPAGGTVTLSGRAEGGRLFLAVADTGPGVAPEDAGHIFQRFYRSDAARGDKQHFGLGLSIADELARLHGGTLRLAQTGPEGSVFELSLEAAE